MDVNYSWDHTCDTSRNHSIDGCERHDEYGIMHQYQCQPSLAVSTLTPDFNRRLENTSFLPHDYNGNGNRERSSHGDVNQYHQQPLLAEGVLKEHKGGSGIPTNRNNVICLDHPYTTEYNFTSRFPIGFRGYFICGGDEPCIVKKG